MTIDAVCAAGGTVMLGHVVFNDSALAVCYNLRKPGNAHARYLQCLYFEENVSQIKLVYGKIKTICVFLYISAL